MKKKLSEITVPVGRRNIDYVKVSELAESIKIVGLLNPITIDKEDTLIAGAHRFEACKHLGFDEIECIVLDCDELRIELAEIDENLIRSDLDAISMGEMANRRDEILEELGLRAKVGDNQHTRGGAVPAPPQTTANIAKEAGVSERVLQENKQLARDLVPEAKEVVKEKKMTKKDALAVSRLEPDEQREAVKQIESGERYKPEKPTKRKTVAKESEPERDDEIAELEASMALFYEMCVGKKPEKFLKIPMPNHYATESRIFCVCYADSNDELKRKFNEETEKLSDALYDLTHPE
ncbi:MAG: ParB N-terminal domain-containing protein [Planctomycetaceae bacterium]|nr:ParB N-terminal domain-containing protein [Planctomycetaceae bacterium]